MIPDSGAGLVAFLLLLAPGIVWELQRGKHEPAVKETALLEAARIVLASLMATAGAAALLLWMWVPLYLAHRAAQATGASGIDSVLILGGVIATAAVACCAVMALAAWRWPKRPTIHAGRAWDRAFVGHNISAERPPYLTVQMIDGTVWRGFLATYDTGPEDANRSLVLSGPFKRKKPGDHSFSTRALQSGLVLPESQILSIQFAYAAE